MAFQVVNIISGDVIEVKGWQWGELTGTLVKITNYTIEDPSYIEYARKKLETLLRNQMVDLKDPIKVDKGEGDSNILYCSIYLNDINIIQYFPELKDNNVA